MYLALHDSELCKRERIANMLDSVGLCAHHSAASLLICMFLAGVVKPEQSIYDSVLILCIQHVFTILQYSYKFIYIAIELILEVWFEWSVISNLELFLSNHWSVALCASVLLMSHWLYLICGVLRLIGEMTLCFRVAKPAVPDSNQIEGKTRTIACHRLGVIGGFIGPV